MTRCFYGLLLAFALAACVDSGNPGAGDAPGAADSSGDTALNGALADPPLDQSSEG